jgi:hypothetical protein
MIRQFIRSVVGFLARLFPIGAGARRGNGEDFGGAGVTANLSPRTPVLVGSASRSYPPEDQ